MCEGTVHPRKAAALMSLGFRLNPPENVCRPAQNNLVQMDLKSMY